MKKPSIKTEKDLIAEILNGKYRDCHLIYNRKSTDEGQPEELYFISKIRERSIRLSRKTFNSSNYH